MDFSPAGMAAASSNVGGLGLAQAVLYAGSWRVRTAQQYETGWADQNVDKEALGIKDAYDEELYKFAFDQDSLGQIFILFCRQALRSQSLPCTIYSMFFLVIVWNPFCVRTWIIRKNLFLFTAVSSCLSTKNLDHSIFNAVSSFVVHFGLSLKMNF